MIANQAMNGLYPLDIWIWIKDFHALFSIIRPNILLHSNCMTEYGFIRRYVYFSE